MSADDLARLVDIAEAVDQAAQLRLARAAGLARRIHDEIASLAAAGGADPTLLFAPGGLQAAAWHHAWIDGHRCRLLVRLAEVRAEMEAARLAAAQTFGRLSALRELAVEADLKARNVRLKRALAMASAADPSSLRRFPP